MKPLELQYSYKKQIGFTQTQKQSLLKLRDYGVNVNDFIRLAVREKIQRDWKQIREQKHKESYPF